MPPLAPQVHKRSVKSSMSSFTFTKDYLESILQFRSGDGDTNSRPSTGYT